MNFIFWITVNVVGFLTDVALEAGLGLLFTAPPQVAVFYIGADDVQISVPMNVLRGGFEKNLLKFLRGKGDVGHPNFFMRSIWLKNEKLKIFHDQRETRGEEVNRCIFCIRVAYLLVSELIFQFRN